MRALGWSLVVALPLSFGLLCFAAAPAWAQSDPGAMWTVGGPPAPPPAPAPSSPPAPGPSSDPAPSSAPAAPPEPPSPPPDGASWQLGAGLSGVLYSAKYVDSPDTGGNSAGGSLSADRFLSPVVDDGAPRSLQPFLQRTSQVSASIGGGMSTIRNPYGGADRTSGNASLGLGLDIYLARYFAIAASAGYGYRSLPIGVTTQETHSLRGSAGFGVRIDDTRIDASYAFGASNSGGVWADPRWGSVSLSLLTVLYRCFTLRPSGSFYDGGGQGGLDLGYFPTQDLGFFLGGGGGGQDSSGVESTSYGIDVGFSYWVIPAVRVGATYAFSRTELATNGTSVLAHSLSLGATLRLR